MVPSCPIETGHGRWARPPSRSPEGSSTATCRSCEAGSISSSSVRCTHPGGRPVPWLDVDIQVGRSFQRTLRVFGDRHWVRQGEDLVPSEPVPFERMSLGWDRAFGGQAEVEAGMLPWGDNPHGTGFYMFDWQAEGQPLPNLEDPYEPIRTWTDRPRAVGTGPYPVRWGLRQRNGVEIDEDNPAAPIRSLRRTLFNNAHPDFIVPDAVRPGDTIRVAHGRPGGDLVLSMPELRLHAHVQLEHKHWLFPLHLDQIVVMTGDDGDVRLLLAHRVCFRYRIVAEERRAVSLREGRVPDTLPTSYPVDFARMEPWR